jgi:hypothetical protein
VVSDVVPPEVVLDQESGEAVAAGLVIVSKRAKDMQCRLLDRLGSGVDRWQARLKALRRGQFLGRFFATSRERLRAVAERLGLKRVPNLGGCPAS